MTLLSDGWFVVKWSVYCVGTLLHRIYQFTVFLSKPGASILLAYVAHGITLYLHIRHAGLPKIDFERAWTEWYESLRLWLTYDVSERSWWAYIELPLLIAAIMLHALPFKLLKRALGLFPAMPKPLPPLRKLRVKPLKIKAHRAKVSIRKKRRPRVRFFRRQKLPKELRRLLSTSRKVVT